MKKYLLAITSVCCLICASAQELSFFLPKGNFSYDPNIPTPKHFFGHEIGEQHITYDMASVYLKLLSEKSDRVKAEDRGRTYQYRPILFLYISAPKNMNNLEQIRQNHLKLCDYKESDKVNVSESPVVTWLGYSIHGNEASGVNASIAVAYFLAAAQGAEVERILNNSVIIMQPGTNPDGIQRFATWVNNARSFTPVKDPNSREFREPAPGSRTNHYWFDLNRDWITVQHPESYYRADVLYEWHPTLFSDFHEQGTTSGMFFSPGIKTSQNPTLPKENFDMMEKIAKHFHNKYLSEIGSLTFTKETFDTWFPGTGDVLPGLLGGVSFLFEQTSARGHIQERNGVTVRFSDAIRNQAYGSYSTIQAAVDMREELLDYQRNAYKGAQKEAAAATIKGYVFGNPQNKSFDIEFFHILKTNNINVYKLNRNVSVSGKNFSSADSYIVPCDQQEIRMIRTIFESKHHFVDSVFYDVTTWNVPLAFSMNWGEVTSTSGLVGEKVERIAPSSFDAPAVATFAYLCELKDFYAYPFLYRLLSEEVKVRVGDAQFKMTIDDKVCEFDYGTLMIPVNGQKFDKERLHRLITEAAKGVPVEVFALHHGMGEPIDLGSPRFREITLPKIALIWGQGASTDGIGSIWHLLDHRMKVPATLLEYTLVSSASVDLSSYNVIVVSGNVRFDKAATDRLKAWTEQRTNTIIAVGQAYRILNEAGVANINTQKRAENENKATYLDFFNRSEMAMNDPNASISGVILESYLDTSHPIAYGMGANSINTMKNSVNIFSKPTGRYMSPVYYQKSPLLSGCITAKNLALLAETPCILASRNAIYFADDPCFRAHWFGSMRLLLNSFFFRELMPSEKVETVSGEKETPKTDS